MAGISDLSSFQGHLLEDAGKTPLFPKVKLTCPRKTTSKRPKQNTQDPSFLYLKNNYGFPLVYDHCWTLTHHGEFGRHKVGSRRTPAFVSKSQDLYCLDKVLYKGKCCINQRRSLKPLSIQKTTRTFPLVSFTFFFGGNTNIQQPQKDPKGELKCPCPRLPSWQVTQNRQRKAGFTSQLGKW